MRVPRIEFVCRKMDCEPPVICTPQEFLEINDADRPPSWLKSARSANKSPPDLPMTCKPLDAMPENVTPQKTRLSFAEPLVPL